MFVIPDRSIDLLVATVRRSVGAFRKKNIATIYRSADEILQEADAGGMRRAFIVTALLLEMEAVRGHLRLIGSVMGRDGAVYECGVYSDSGKDWLVVVVNDNVITHYSHGYRG